ncbi:OmpA family protein [Hydrogenophaga sp.]|uniref:OmpA family protein n=1 Tax=Hydrogenophaga sp. TaxID=1904254 RepID=UPI00272F4602|nr:OmpA family protein [Hydrogenophaga sp.]MDP2016680.1 OmpA family protein [Hydrogenophaga sp.]MDP3166240.1 OmpA family protein [Hydrogenophaga sp.]MDP3813099.1 OmpA family protein [Hydrogenophaga sp.]
MSSQDTEVEYRVVAVLLVAVIVLVTGFAVGLGIHKSRGGTVKTVAVAPVAAAPAMAAASSDDASVVVENGVVKFYFASGKADLAPGAMVALGDAIAAAKAGKRLVLSGFHDATGDPAFNAELARKRALAVRDALVGAGVAVTSMELKKPEQTTGSGNDAEARRVEVMIAG